MGNFTISKAQSLIGTSGTYQTTTRFQWCASSTHNSEGLGRNVDTGTTELKTLNLHVDFVLHLTVQKLFDIRVEGCQPPVRIGVREVNVHVCSRRDDVEFRVEYIDTFDHSVQSWHREGGMTLILSDHVLAVQTDSPDC